MNKKGFTLAEVLITLGIIGVVAAMTLPTLIQNYRKHEVETKLAKVYSVVNQAIKLSTVEYGEPAEWDDWDCGHSGGVTCTTDEAIEKFNKYIGNHLHISKIEKSDDGKSFYVYLNDGGILQIYNYLYDIVFHTNPKYIKNTSFGTYSFIFKFEPKLPSLISQGGGNYAYVVSPMFEPYLYGWDGTNEGLTRTSNNIACGGTKSNYCTKLIQMNGWKIPKDYPFKF